MASSEKSRKNAFSFSLPAGDPAGLQISAAGLLTWPTPVLGTYTAVVIDVTDSQGGVGRKTFALDVVPDPGSGKLSWQNTPPATIQLGSTYVYLPIADDTAAYPLTYSLVAPYPVGMQMDPTTSLITWTPTVAQLGDNNPFTVQVGDGRETLTQTIVPGVDVTDEATDHPPQITSTPGAFAVVGDLYQYVLTASSPDHDALSWTLDSGPTGMALDPITNTLVWTPTADQADTEPPVTVSVHDGQGGWAGQSFAVVLAAAAPPQFDDFAPSTVAGVNTPYAYQVAAHDPDGSPVSYAVTGTPCAGSA